LTLIPSGGASPAGRSACNLNSSACPGYHWGGVTSQRGVTGNTVNVSAGAISFVTDLSKTAVAGLEWDVIGERCSAFPGRPIPIAGSDSRHEYRVVAGRFSITSTYVYAVATRAKFPGVTSQLTGTFAGNRASGTVRWSLAGPYKGTCTPSSGSFPWHAVITARIQNA
jgi:hypothetical protein